MTKYPDLFAALAAPFETQEVKIRATQGGRPLHYITARTAMNRLDTVLGPENWWDEYHPGAHSVMCRLSIRLPDGNTLTKCDAGGYAGMADQGDDDKSGFSDAFKRAAAKFGVARYLYRDGVPAFAQTQTNPEPAATPPAPGRSPRSGRALFAWTKEQEERHETGLLKYLNNWGKLQDFPTRMIDWDAEQVALAYAEATRKLQAVGNAHLDTYEEALSN